MKRRPGQLRRCAARAAPLLLLCGCHAVYPYQPQRADRGADGARPGDRGSADRAADAPPADGTPAEAALPDGAAKRTRCGLAVDETTLALYTFDDDPPGVLVDELGAHPGEIVEPSAEVRHEALDGCSSALSAYTSTGARAALIPHGPAWDLDEGAVELRVRFDTPPATPNGVLARDAKGQALPGHLLLQRSVEGVLVARLQSVQGDGFRCSNQILAAGQWYEVVVRFGAAGLQLVVDGVPATRSGEVDLWAAGVPQTPCGVELKGGIAGNGNAWVLGAATNAADEGSYPPYPIGFPLRGAIDYLRIRAAP